MNTPHNMLTKTNDVLNHDGGMIAHGCAVKSIKLDEDATFTKLPLYVAFWDPFFPMSDLWI